MARFDTRCRTQYRFPSRRENVDIDSPVSATGTPHCAAIGLPSDCQKDAFLSARRAPHRRGTTRWSAGTAEGHRGAGQDPRNGARPRPQLRRFGPASAASAARPRLDGPACSSAPRIGIWFPVSAASARDATPRYSWPPRCRPRGRVCRGDWLASFTPLTSQEFGYFGTGQRIC